MKKIIINSIFILVLLMFINVVNPAKSEADWWDRPDLRPSQPSIPRDVVLLPTQPQPTSVPPTTAVPTNNPTSAPTNTPGVTTAPTPTNPPTGGTPSTGGNGGSSTDSNGNACDPGKSYTGPYCGWSPSTGGSNGGSAQYQPRIGGGPRVLGLSNTSGSDIAWSDIIMLAGVLCLTLYARSKLIMENKAH